MFNPLVVAERIYSSAFWTKPIFPNFEQSLRGLRKDYQRQKYTRKKQLTDANRE
jgi:hypothetical protein